MYLALCLTSSIEAQQPVIPWASPQDSSAERMAKILQTLEPDSSLRYALEHGNRGDGVHRAWMDAMKQHGIKQASFTVRFAWHHGVRSLRVTSVTFLQRYYRNDTKITDRALLRQIRDEGLETQLRNAVLVRARERVGLLMKKVTQTAPVKSRRAHGTLYLNLLDDEVLPVLDEMPDVESS